MTDKNELILKSHEELMYIVRFLRLPSLVVPRSGVDIESLNALSRHEAGTIYVEREKGDIRFVHEGLSQEVMNEVVKTFCESHRRLQ